jgi:sugar phosphate isomerase/epimerase
MDRRTFLARAALGGLAGYGLSACAGGTPASGAAGIERLGVQLYSVRDRMNQDVRGTLAAIAAIGYQEVETAGLYNLTPQAFREELDRAGLVSTAGHYGLNDLRQNVDGTLEIARTLGQEWVVVPSLGGDDRTPEGYRRVADELNRFAQTAGQRGLKFAYHNHDWEFAPLDDPAAANGYDLLLALTDPDLVGMELDIFWAIKGGEDPLGLFGRYPGRFPLCHVKDMADMQGAQRMTDVGSGEVDFGRIFQQSAQAGLQHYFVEHDSPEDSLASVTASHDYLRSAGFLR